MLQALGSNTKTRISYVMFGGCCFLIAGAFLVARMERIEFDESYAYCATVYYSPKTGYRIEYWGQRNDFERISTGCARACFKDRKSTNGLSFLEIESQSGYKDQHQAVSAGILEGSLTWMSIYAQWTNTIQAVCDKNEENQQFCSWLRDIVGINYKNVVKMAREKNRNDHYHHQIFLFYQQLVGIEIGFKKGVKRARRDFEIPFVDFLLLNSRVDIEDLKIYYNKFVVKDKEELQMDVNPRVGKMVLKILLPDGGEQPQVLVGHSSDADYTAMLKIVKTYRLNYHHGPEASSNLVTNTDITFTSYPASIASSDAFYLAMGKHSRIIVAGITLKHHHSAQLLHGIDLEGTVFSSARVMAANRLSQNGKFWSRVMALDPDIGAKQWMVVDEKRMKYLPIDGPVSTEGNEAVTSSTTTDDGLMRNNEVPTNIITSADHVKFSPSNRNLVWLIDQTWRRLHAEDSTARFRSDGDGWTLDGTPYFKVIQELNGLQPRSIKANQKMMSLEDVAQFLKLNSYRGDLLIDSKTTFGNVDLKLYTSEDHELIVQNGPITTNTSQPFDWSNDDFVNTRHDEHPIVWNFSPIQVQFLWN